MLFQNEEKDKRAAELIVATKELIFQNEEKEKRATELVITNQALSIAAAAFESSAAIVVTDKNNNILRVNLAFNTITGHTVEDVIGQELPPILFGHQDKILNEAAWSRANQEGQWEGEILSIRKNGEAYQQFLTIKVVKDQDDAISYYVSTFIDITERRAVEDEIKSLAFYDPLTLLPNRRLFADRVKHALLTCSRLEPSCAVMLLDIDHFKTLNDSLGHHFGDLLLQQVATRISHCIREADTVARMGGDEFVVLLEALSIETFEAATQTEVIAQKILYSLNQPYQLDGHEYHSSASIGMTIFGDNKVALDVILKQADIAMYQAKTDGRNSICFYDPKMQEVIVARADMEKDLREAIKNNSFQLYCQIQVDSTGRPIGAEALIRWKHPERGIICPSDFIDLAEESRLILPIGQWVLDTACAQLKIWQKNPLTRDLVLSINISARQFHQKDFVKQVKETLQMHKVNPARLKLELTESMLVKNISDIMKTMNALNKIGICFSLDDFGTGYSSLKYLKILPLNELKIDRSFVRDITAGASDKAIVIAIISMANSLNINVIAEGVETEEQRQCLLDIGCSDYQGYLFGEPMPIDEFEALLKKG
ncbi:MAG: EAL domain-containing protein [Pseudomonadota bacterium]|nr:EAL domain-containing protein [Pseudomonadota bacterium]